MPNEARVPSPARERGPGAAGETGLAVLPDRCNMVGCGSNLSGYPERAARMQIRVQAFGPPQSVTAGIASMIGTTIEWYDFLV